MRTGDLLLETLALHPRVPVEQLAVAWRTVSPRGVAALVAFEEASLWLLRRIRELGIEASAPVPLVDALGRTAKGEQARSMLVDADTEELLRYLSDRGIPSVLIKGTARRASAGRYPYADARSTRDVDVLLSKSDARAVWDDLRKLGWPLAMDPAATRAGHYHPPPLLGPHRTGIELHWSIGHNYSAVESWQRANGEAEEVEWHQLRVRVPSATELLWHGLTHAVRAGFDGFRLRFFLDGASIIASRAEIDWDRIGARLALGEAGDVTVARAWLGTAAILAGGDLPAAVSGSAPDFDPARTLTWRHAVLTRWGTTGFAGRLLEEGTRADLGLGVAPVVEGTGPYKQTRRWIAGRTARLAYRAWRVAAQGAGARISGRGGR
jgi:hypothetical protein